MTVHELNILIRAKADNSVRQQTDQIKKSIGSINQAAQQAAASPISKQAQRQLDQLQGQLDRTSAKIKQKEAEMA